MSEQTKAPSAGTTRGENTTHPNEEEKVMNTTTVRETIRPIYGPSDIRWDELAHWFEINAERLHEKHGDRVTTIESLTPSERGDWHALRVLGLDTYMATFDYPEVPDHVQGPAWATSTDDYNIDPETEFPVKVWRREVVDDSNTLSASVEQCALYSPDDGAVTWRRPVLIVWVDENTRVVIEDPKHACQLLGVIREGVGVFEQVLQAAS